MSDVATEALTEVFERDPMIQVGYLFGSRYKGTGMPESDIDVAVLLSELPDDMLDYYLDLMGRLSEVLGDSVDLVVLNTAPPLLKHEIIKSGKLVYSRNETTRVEFEARSEREHLDFSRFRERYDESLLEEITEWKG